jgi:tetratricopeptide (TPR) repeat protein
MNPEALYTSAVTEYELGRFDKAHDLFSLLSTELPAQPEVWKGLAACSQVQKCYPEALLAWGMAALLNEHDPLPHFHAAECLFAQGEKQEAQKAIRLALGLPCTEEVLDQIVRLKEVIDNG